MVTGRRRRKGSRKRRKMMRKGGRRSRGERGGGGEEGKEREEGPGGRGGKWREGREKTREKEKKKIWRIYLGNRTEDNYNKNKAERKEVKEQAVAAKNGRIFITKWKTSLKTVINHIKENDGSTTENEKNVR